MTSLPVPDGDFQLPKVDEVEKLTDDGISLSCKYATYKWWTWFSFLLVQFRNFAYQTIAKMHLHFALTSLLCFVFLAYVYGQTSCPNTTCQPTQSFLFVTELNV